MAETDDNLASILSDVERVLGIGNKRGPAHRSTSMHLASGVLCFQTHKNPAVQRCCNLRNSILCEPLTPEDRQQSDEEFLRLYDLFEKEIDEDSENYEIANTAALAYRTAMPEPTSRRSAKSFIACVVHAMAINIVNQNDGAGLIRGARAAALTFNRTQTREKKPEAPAAEELPATEAAA
jgi:hypothetical protein